MSSQRAIIKCTRKLLSRIYHILKYKEEYKIITACAYVRRARKEKMKKYELTKKGLLLFDLLEMGFTVKEAREIIEEYERKEK